MPNFSIPLSGLTADATALSAIANNLANQNTTGYKDTQVLFSDLFYQNLGTTGSGDPIQLGAGAQVGSMPSMFTQGSVSSTGVPTDVAIQGDGFFVLQQDGVTSYSRAGNFSVDKNNFLVSSSGQDVLGYPATNGVVDTGQALAPLQLGAGTISPPSATGNVTIDTNLDASATVGGTDGTYSTPLTIYDSLGTSHTLTFTFTKTAANTWNYSASVPASDLGPLNGNAQTGVLATGTLTFDGDGNLIGPTQNGKLVSSINITATNLSDGASDMSFNWDLLNGTTPVITQVAGASSTSSAQQDGASSGTLTDFSIGSDGTITGSFSNGKTAALGQVALASFANEQGLQRAGDTDYTETLASGQAVIGTPGTAGRGTLSGGALELSNVDISSEFANLIVAQRAFEANAKAVTTFDTIMEDTINMKQT
ncbi:MAG TPA: flagellar hook protein FlgE [Terriglobales bacterium]|nr:flagellar hook protein FlgE [Terriglobales bacterium]